MSKVDKEKILAPAHTPLLSPSEDFYVNISPRASSKGSDQEYVGRNKKKIEANFVFKEELVQKH